MNIRQYEKCKELYENVRDDTKSIIGVQRILEEYEKCEK